MKRSGKLSLILMGTLAATTLAGCGEEQEVSIFKNRQECIEGGFTAEQCFDFETQAKANSPKFNKREECEEEYGKAMCSGGVDSNGDFWTPALMGFMVGNMLSNHGGTTNISVFDKDKRDLGSSTTSATSAAAATSANQARPVPVIANGLYNNPENPGHFKSSSGTTIRPNLGKAVVPSRVVTSRGGFAGGARVMGG